MAGKRVALSEPERMVRFDAKWTPEPNSGCWIWTGATNAAGYGVFSAGPSKAKTAHRWGYERLVGPVPAGLELDHLCRVRCCVNPHHLDPVPGAVNVARGLEARGLGPARSVCKHGHPLVGDNIYVRPNGRRECRECAGRPLRRGVKCCIRGHEQVPANVYSRPDGKPECALCRRARRSSIN